jgi:hypothetical protein
MEADINTDLGKQFHDSFGPVPVHPLAAFNPHPACGTGKPLPSPRGKSSCPPAASGARSRCCCAVASRRPHISLITVSKCRRTDQVAERICRTITRSVCRLPAPIGRLLNQEPHHLQVLLRWFIQPGSHAAGRYANLRIATQPSVDDDLWRRHPIFRLGRRDRCRVAGRPYAPAYRSQSASLPDPVAWRALRFEGNEGHHRAGLSASRVCVSATRRLCQRSHTRMSTFRRS